MTPRGEQHSATPVSLLDVDRRWTTRELAAEVCVCQKTVIHILQDILGYRKFVRRWTPNDIAEVQKWHRYAVALALRDRYQREGDDFLGPIVPMDEIWARLYEPNLKRQSNEWKYPGSPRSKKMHPTQCAMKVVLIVAYDIGEIILHHAVPPRHTVNDFFKENYKESMSQFAQETRFGLRAGLTKSAGTQ